MNFISIDNEPIPGRDYTGLVVNFYCHDSAGKFVMAKRGKNARDEQGRWDIGSGLAKHGESVEYALRREIREEYCSYVISLEFLGYRDVFRKKPSYIEHLVVFDFKALVDPSKVSIGELNKLEEIGWYTLDNLPNPLHSQVESFFEAYKHLL